MWAKVGPDAEERAAGRLRDDLASGRWAERNRDLVESRGGRAWPSPARQLNPAATSPGRPPRRPRSMNWIIQSKLSSGWPVH